MYKDAFSLKFLLPLAAYFLRERITEPTGFLARTIRRIGWELPRSKRLPIQRRQWCAHRSGRVVPVAFMPPKSCRRGLSRPCVPGLFL